MAMAFKKPIEPKKISTLAKHDKGYGTPVEGSKTEARAKLAHERISREILELCCVIADNGKKIKTQNFHPSNVDEAGDNADTGTSTDDIQQEQFISEIDFKRLFDIYVGISNKLVGVLLRARKYGIVDFPGETLFQRRDDDVIIKLLYSPNEVKSRLKEKAFSWGKCM